MFRDGKPRYWIPGYDGAFLVVPLLLAAVIGGLVWLPKPPPVRQNVTAVPPRPMLPPVILEPPPGSLVTANEAFTISGSAEPGSVVRLNYFLNGVDVLLAEQPYATNGVWAFSLNRLQPGAHTFRASSFLAGRTLMSGEITYLAKVKPRPPAAKRPAATPPAKKR
jgi:hypothetical protein